MRFQPESLEVAAGDTVVWRNQDIVPHTSTALDGGWASGDLAPDSSWRAALHAPGTHAYRCDYHPTMTGSVRVR